MVLWSYRTVIRTGLRVGEAVALKGQDLDLRSRYVLIERNFTHGHLEETPKGGRNRRVDLTRDLLAVLQDHLTLQEAEAALDAERKSPWLCQSPEGELIVGTISAIAFGSRCCVGLGFGIAPSKPFDTPMRHV
jgi:integrase